jgi:hypothetical protein
VIAVLISKGLEGREGEEGPASRPTVNRWSGLNVKLDLEFNNDEQGDERGEEKTSPLR